MLLSDAGFQLIEHLERQKDVPSLLASFQELVRAFGMGGFCIGDPSNPEVPRKDRLWAVTWSEGWLRRYVEQRYYLTDPIIRQMNQSALPFRWSSTRGGATLAERRVLNEAAEFGMRDGFSVAIYGLDGAVSGVSVAAEHYKLDKRDEMALHLASLYFHAKLAGMRATEARQPAVRLTPRERECLTWVASGKTDWEIAHILNISEQTAHGYVQNALAKLGASTRAQAVAVAVLSRQILQ